MLRNFLECETWVEYRRYSFVRWLKDASNLNGTYIWYKQFHGVCNIAVDRACRVKWSAEAYSRVSAPVGSMGGKHASAPSRYQYLEESCAWFHVKM